MHPITGEYSLRKVNPTTGMHKRSYDWYKCLWWYRRNTYCNIACFLCTFVPIQHQILLDCWYKRQLEVYGCKMVTDLFMLKLVLHFIAIQVKVTSWELKTNSRVILRKLSTFIAKPISTLCRSKFCVNYVFSCEWSKIYLWWQPIDRLLFCYNIATVGLTDSGMKQMKRVEYRILSIVFMMWMLKSGWRIVWKRIRIRQKRILSNWKICLAKHIMNRIRQTIIKTAKKLRFNIWGKRNIARLVSWIISVCWYLWSETEFKQH